MAKLDVIPTPPAQKRENFMRRTLPVVVWSACVLSCAALMFQRTRTVEYIGVAQARTYEISAPADGVLQTVPVELFDRVQAGDTVARLDDRHLQAQLDVARASVGSLEAELGAVQAQLRQGSAAAGYTADLRRFQVDEEERRLQAVSIRVELATDRIEVERLELEVRRFAQLLEAGLLSEQEFDERRLARNQVRTRIRENQDLLLETEEEYEAARDRRIRYEAGLKTAVSDSVLANPLQQAIRVEEARLAEIEILRESLTLKSPVQGRVSQILCRKGQAIVPGEPILTVTEPSVEEIVAYIAGHDRLQPEENQAVLVSNLRGGAPVGESIVLAVSPDIQALPQQLWRNPQFPDYGRAVRIAAIPSLDLTPGESVRVRFLD